MIIKIVLKGKMRKKLNQWADDKIVALTTRIEVLEG